MAHYRRAKNEGKMSTAYVILAAGKGTRMGRVGDGLHKALLPLQRKAILTHLIELAPPGADVIVATGHLDGQLATYLEMAHPQLTVTYVSVPGWDKAGAGPGASLMACKDAVGDRDMVFTSCDTIWKPDPRLWESSVSWGAYAPVPAGTPPERWCRFSVHDNGPIGCVIDKSAGWVTATQAYVGLAMVKCTDLPVFWNGIQHGSLISGEQQVSGGLSELARHGKLEGRRVTWTDTGDEVAYRRAVIAHDGFDWSKSHEATWVLPESKRVIKWWADSSKTTAVQLRQAGLQEPRNYGGVPSVMHSGNGMLAMQYIPGESGYQAMHGIHDLADFIDSPAMACIAKMVTVDPVECEKACLDFYVHKTRARISIMRPGLAWLAQRVVDRLDLGSVVNGCIPTAWHGDLNLGNVIHGDDGNWYLIDWRSDFGGNSWGDYRHDLGKLIAGFRVRWDWAQRGLFTPWPLGAELETAMRDSMYIPAGTDVIGILSMLSAAPLMEQPLDEVMVARAAEWVSEL
jgi:hypothetical protein